MENYYKIYKIGVLLVVIIIFLPFLNYFHLIFSNTESTIEFLGFNIKHDFVNNQVWAWSILNYSSQLILISLAYFTSESFYKYLLLPIISLYCLAIASILGVIPSLYVVPFSFNILIIAILSIIFILILDRKRFSSIRKAVVNKIVTESIVEWVNSSVKNGISRVLHLKEERKRISNYIYLRKAVYLKNAFHKKYKFLKANSNYNSNRRFMSLDIAICFMIVMIYFSWFLPYFIPDNLPFIEFFGVKLGAFGFKDFSMFVWFVSRKLVIIFILSSWFITSPHWWRYAILSPLIIYSYQFWEAFQDVSELDSVGNLRVFPLVVLNVALVIMVSRFVKYRSQFMAVYEEISREVDEMLDEMKSKYPQEAGETLERIRQGKKGKGYRQKLRALEKEIAARLDLTNG